MPILEANGSRINYIRIDCESGNDCEDLVMVHGLATNMAFWYIHHVPEFSKKFRITLFDLRGHGRSAVTESGYTPKNMAEDLRHLLVHLQIKRAHFIAHSFGGLVALNLACTNPDLFASLILVDSQIYAIRKLQKAKEWLYGKKIQPVLVQNNLDLDINDPFFGYRLLTAMARLLMTNSQISPELEDLVNPLMGKSCTRTAGRWLKLMETISAEHELMGDDGLSPAILQNLNFPILAMYGENSQAMSTGEQLLKVWPHAYFRRLREAGHFFPLSRPAEFMENCHRFWQGAFSREPSGRKADTKAKHFRSDRIYCRKNQWFLYTRELIETGPFADRDEVENHLLRLSRSWAQGKTD